MKPRHRWFQYSLRSFLVLMTALAVWLGVVVNRAREQREAVEAIEALGGAVVYDWQLVRYPSGGLAVRTHGKPDGPAWVRRLIGNDFFQEVKLAVLQKSPEPPEDRNVPKAIRHFKRLRGLEAVTIPWVPVTFEEAAAALPQCRLSAL